MGIDGENGWLMPAGTMASLEEALKEYLAAPVDKPDQMGAAACRPVIERHSIESEAKKIPRLVRTWAL